MNDVTLYIYLIDVLGSKIPTLFGVTITALIVAFLLRIIFRGIQISEHTLEGRAIDRTAKILVSGALFLGVILALIPSQEAMYLMVGSELTEATVNTQIGQDALEVVRQRLSEMVSESDG